MLFSSYLLDEVKFVIYPESDTFVAGRTVLLTCVAYGSPTNPNITWSRNDYPVEAYGNVNIHQSVVIEGGVSFVVSILEICGISDKEAGIYTCSATARDLTGMTPYFQVNVTMDACE